MPFDVLGGERGSVALGRADFPKQSVKKVAFGIPLSREDALMIIVDAMIKTIGQVAFRQAGPATAAAMDATGLETTTASAHFQYRKGGERRKWIKLWAKVNHGEAAGLLASVSDGLIGPVNVLGLEVGNVTLRAAPFRVLLSLNDQLVFLNGNGAFWLETNFRPETLGNERPGKPVHRKAKVVEFPHVDIGADRASLEAGEKLLGVGPDSQSHHYRDSGWLSPSHNHTSREPPAQAQAGNGPDIRSVERPNTVGHKPYPIRVSAFSLPHNAVSCSLCHA